MGEYIVPEGKKPLTSLGKYRHSLRKLVHDIFTYIFSSVNWKNFSDFNIFAQNIDCGYKKKKQLLLVILSLVSPQ